MIKFVSFRTKKIMKKIFSLLLFFYGLFGFAQLDTDHWFAPIPARAGIGGYEGYLYLSTNETTPFQVTIYSNNSVFTTTTISKGNPAQISIPSNLMMGLPQADLFTSSTKGLNLKASKKFFANYRLLFSENKYNIEKVVFSDGVKSHSFNAIGPTEIDFAFKANRSRNSVLVPVNVMADFRGSQSVFMEIHTDQGVITRYLLKDNVKAPVFEELSKYYKVSK